MSQQYDNINSGALFRNGKKRSQNSPDHTGQAEIACPHCGAVHETWISAWVKVAKNTQQKFFSLAFSPKENNTTRTPAPENDKSFDDFDDDIPF